MGRLTLMRDKINLPLPSSVVGTSVVDGGGMTAGQTGHRMRQEGGSTAIVSSSADPGEERKELLGERTFIRRVVSRGKS